MTRLSIRDLTVRVPTAVRPILSDVSLDVDAAEVVGIVGESGSGKSTTARAALGLLPHSADVTGQVLVGNHDVLGADQQTLRDIRLRQVGMIYQNPGSALNPVRTVGAHAMEQLQVGLRMGRRDARRRVLELFAAVGLPDPEQHFQQYPHELSGGMLQRAVIASALLTDPGLILADEATSALDVSTQAEIVALLRRLQRERELSIVFITHDLALAAAICDRICVMYAGRVVEVGPSADVLVRPSHPYTAALRDSSPEIGADRVVRPIPGTPLSLGDAVEGCPFHARCSFAQPRCTEQIPPLVRIGHQHSACLRAGDVAAEPVQPSLAKELQP